MARLLIGPTGRTRCPYRPTPDWSASTDTERLRPVACPAPYNIPGDESAQDRQMDLIRSKGAILNVGPEGKFELFFASEFKAVTFEIQDDSQGQYKISEIARRDMTLDQFIARKESKDEMISERPLRFRGKIELKPAHSQPDSPIRNISTFAFDDRGNIAFERFDKINLNPSSLIEFPFFITLYFTVLANILRLRTFAWLKLKIENPRSKIVCTFP